jgi:plastocyanin
LPSCGNRRLHRLRDSRGAFSPFSPSRGTYALTILALALMSSIFASSQLMTRANGSTSYSVTIVDYSFRPQTINITTGTDVVWTFLTNGTDSGDFHTVTANNQTQAGGGVFQSPNMHPGQTFSFTFYSPGKYPYHCSVHPSMIGLVNVTGPMMTPPATNNPLLLYLGIGGVAAVVLAGTLALYLRRRSPRTTNSVTTLRLSVKNQSCRSMVTFLLRNPGYGVLSWYVCGKRCSTNPTIFAKSWMMLSRELRFVRN